MVVSYFESQRESPTFISAYLKEKNVNKKFIFKLNSCNNSA